MGSNCAGQIMPTSHPYIIDHVWRQDRRSRARGVGVIDRKLQDQRWTRSRLSWPVVILTMVPTRRPDTTSGGPWTRPEGARNVRASAAPRVVVPSLALLRPMAAADNQAAERAQT